MRSKRTYTYDFFGRHFSVWFDGVWYAIELDDEGNQIGDTIDDSNKDRLMVWIGMRLTNGK